MSSIREKFVVPKRYNTVALILMGIGIISIIALYIATHSGTFKDDHAKEHADARFWASLLQNSVYFLLVVNAAMFFICATTLAWGGWQMAFRRVSEAISTCVPILGVICGAILLSIVFSEKEAIYHWTNHHHVENDPILLSKAGFLSKGFYATVTVLTVILWSVLGWKMRQLSRSLDDRPLKSLEDRKKYIWRNTIWAALFIIVFALTVMSSIPWLWVMSIDAHWYSTMYSWYTFASTFVAGIALITLFVIFLKNNNYLEYVGTEHLHDLGKFMFAFSIFWTYLWYSQFMLIWYANIPEETVYFVERAQGTYKGIFWIMFIINFIAPILILMSRDAKRNYATISFMAVLIIFGHWLDLYQMVFPSVSPGHVPQVLYDMGIALGFAGTIMFVTGKALAKRPLYAKNHPFLKESLIHHV